ncbi:FMN-binding protein [Allokutzneria sp. A3M-2-11 16]|uniref:FMN-binding protein n=1 Tax=Allokutzneria sp. A3M-2-11 16 TaxID=2962043 RepID=UPI0020B870FC|nr:FMN-binding protein [Allokutzneria sp. A3M-2-11 16]MCP3802761.1 FMN-binding protein [Allokutzneria sp. A3M-2-11 16]
MGRISFALLSTVAVLVLLFGYRTSTGESAEQVQAAPAVPAPAPVAGARTVTGPAVTTSRGVVQVRITLQDNKISVSEAVRFPNEPGRHREINSRAIPQLNAQAVRAQSADIDAVTGATATSQGYRDSLQAALDEAGLT